MLAGGGGAIVTMLGQVHKRFVNDALRMLLARGASCDQSFPADGSWRQSGNETDDVDFWD
jgi:hypothetical protein